MMVLSLSCLGSVNSGILWGPRDFPFVLFGLAGSIVTSTDVALYLLPSKQTQLTDCTGLIMDQFRMKVAEACPCHCTAKRKRKDFDLSGRSLSSKKKSHNKYCDVVYMSDRNRHDILMLTYTHCMHRSTKDPVSSLKNICLFSPSGPNN